MRWQTEEIQGACFRFLDGPTLSALRDALFEERKEGRFSKEIRFKILTQGDLSQLLPSGKYQAEVVSIGGCFTPNHWKITIVVDVPGDEHRGWLFHGHYYTEGPSSGADRGYCDSFTRPVHYLEQVST